MGFLKKIPQNLNQIISNFDWQANVPILHNLDQAYKLVLPNLDSSLITPKKYSSQTLLKYLTTFQRRIQNLVKHPRWNGTDTVNYFQKKLHHRCLIGLWMRLYNILEVTGKMLRRPLYLYEPNIFWGKAKRCETNSNQNFIIQGLEGKMFAAEDNEEKHQHKGVSTKGKVYSNGALTHYSQVLFIYTHWKHQKTFRLSDVFRGHS